MDERLTAQLCLRVENVPQLTYVKEFGMRITAVVRRMPKKQVFESGESLWLQMGKRRRVVNPS